MSTLKQIQCATYQELGELLSTRAGRWPRVVVATIKGNLRHRIEKLGEEVEYEKLTVKQRRLRDIALNERFDQRIGVHTSRPTWGGGAFLYCEPAHAELVKQNRHLFPFELKSKHVVFSEQFETALRECLEDIVPPETQPKGREAFLKKRAGQIKVYQVVELPAHPMLNLDPIDISRIDPDLMEYLQLPSEAQGLEAHRWDEVWELVQRDEEATIRRQHQNGMVRYVCEVCQPVAIMNLQHLVCGLCTREIEDVDPTSLLAAILRCAYETPPTIYAMGGTD